MDKKRLAINMAAQLLAFAVNMGISFFLAPIIEAQMANTYGFVTLANQFVLYAQIVVSALNTMASRFVTIHIHRGEEQEAREYFSSVFFGNVIMAGIFLLPALVIVIFMGNLPFLHVPADALEHLAGVLRRKRAETGCDASVDLPGSLALGLPSDRAAAGCCPVCLWLLQRHADLHHSGDCHYGTV